VNEFPINNIFNGSVANNALTETQKLKLSNRAFITIYSFVLSL
jgi:hypothetical protein